MDESKITELAGVTLREYYADLGTMIRAQQRANDIVAREVGVVREGFVLSRGHVLDAEVVGCRIRWPDDDEPMVEEPALSGPAEIAHFRLPDPPDNPVIRRELGIARAFFERTGQRPSVGFNGPVTVAALAIGMARFFELAATDPELAENLVNRLTDAVIAWKQYHDAEMGIAPAGNLWLADDSASFLSSSQFARLSLPFMRQWYGAFSGSTDRTLHICANSMHLLNQLATLRLSSFDMGEMVDIRLARTAMPDTYLWRLADWRVIRDGAAPEIERSIGKDLAAGGPGGRFGIHVEGWRGVPLWKVRVVKQCVERHNADATATNRHGSTFGDHYEQGENKERERQF